MTYDVRASITGDARRILNDHLKVGREKPVSYLPIRTVESVIGLTIPIYASLVERSGNNVAVFTARIAV